MAIDYHNRKTTYEYNKNGQLIKTSRPDGSVETIQYDIIGRMVEKKDVVKGINYKALYI